MTTPTAYRATDSLMVSLARAGWGPLGDVGMQGVRSTLKALVDLLPHKSAMGEVTLPQICDAAGLHSPRWVASRMVILETMGIITWRRGGIHEGKPVPSLVRISKQALVDLVAPARRALAGVRAARQQATEQRIKGLWNTSGRKRAQCSSKPSHASLPDAPSPLKGESPTGDSPPPFDFMTALAARRGGTSAQTPPEPPLLPPRPVQPDGTPTISRWRQYQLSKAGHSVALAAAGDAGAE